MEPAKSDPNPAQAGERADFVRARMPVGGLFAGQQWRISPEPFTLGVSVAKEIESLGRVLLQFYRAVNLLYRQSVAGKQPAWIAEWLDRGKPDELIQWQRSPAFKSEMPRVIRPDLLLTEHGLTISELDSVPGGIGLTAWLNQTYSALPSEVMGNADGMLKGFAGIFGSAQTVHVLVSDEAATYRPEMLWLAGQLGPRFKVQETQAAPSIAFNDGDAVYRFFELFDLPNVAGAKALYSLAEQKKIQVTPPFKPMFEEKMLFALLWNRNLREFWRQQLGEAFFARMLKQTPYTWMIDPAPLPPQGAFPELNLTDWRQLKELSQKERQLILKISGFSEKAWGARGVYLGSDLSHADWSEAVDHALASADRSPYVLQRYHWPRLVESAWFDFERRRLVPMQGRVRLCPYYFVSGEGDAARPHLGGVLATITPADKKIIHGMTEAILAPCRV